MDYEEASEAVWQERERVLRQRVEELERMLAVWERAESLPDCQACAAFDAAKGE